jgi:hypothetical protein
MPVHRWGVKFPEPLGEDRFGRLGGQDVGGLLAVVWAGERCRLCLLGWDRVSDRGEVERTSDPSLPVRSASRTPNHFSGADLPEPPVVRASSQPGAEPG